jgi:hypothetical protein
MSEIYFDDLPVELIYRIFDNLDDKTILFNVRYVCKRFYTITNNYNRYTIDFRSISMVDFNILCKILNPLNITKLILFNDETTIGLIKDFLSNFNLEQFINVRDLILSHIEDRELEISLRQLANSSMNTLSIVKFDLYDNKEVKYNLLSTVITRPNLKKLDLEFRLADVKDFPWPIECQIEYLRIGNTIPLTQFYTILNQTPCLKTFILKDCSNKDSIELPLITFPKLNSLTFEQSRMNIDQLKTIILSTPNLIYFKLIATEDLSDGFYLEDLIENNLPLLKTFQFYFHSKDNQDFQAIIQSYQTPFWLQQKHWFINCDVISFNGKTQMRLYSLPLCYNKLEFYSDYDKESFTTYQGMDENLKTMDSVRQLTVALDRDIPNFEHEVCFQILIHKKICF